MPDTVTDPLEEFTTPEYHYLRDAGCTDAELDDLSWTEYLDLYATATLELANHGREHVKGSTS